MTALLVLTSSPTVTPGLTNVINEGTVAQAVLPVAEIVGLFELFVRPVQTLLLVLTGMICVVSGVSILVSIYNSMSDRRHEIAVMRALGASRNTVMTIILLESIMLSLGGGIAGWIAGHTLNVAASGKIEQETGVSIGFFDVAPPVNILELLGVESRMSIGLSMELLLIPGLGPAGGGRRFLARAVRLPDRCVEIVGFVGRPLTKDPCHDASSPDSTASNRPDRRRADDGRHGLPVLFGAIPDAQRRDCGDGRRRDRRPRRLAQTPKTGRCWRRGGQGEVSDRDRDQGRQAARQDAGDRVGVLRGVEAGEEVLHHGAWGRRTCSGRRRCR